MIGFKNPFFWKLEICTQYGEKIIGCLSPKKIPLITCWERSAYPNLLFCMNLLSVGWVKLCQGFIPASVTHIVLIGWVKPSAAYPATSLKISHHEEAKLFSRSWDSNEITPLRFTLENLHDQKLESMRKSSRIC